jgi:hypothetical protein
MPSYGGKSTLRKNVRSSTSRSGKCNGCMDAILNCQSTMKSYYTNKLYIQSGVMVSSSGAAIVIIHYQIKVLNGIVTAPWYVRNSDHHDLRIESVTDIITTFANPHEKILQNYINIKAPRLLNMNNITRWLKRKKPFELVRC